MPAASFASILALSPARTALAEAISVWLIRRWSSVTPRLAQLYSRSRFCTSPRLGCSLRRNSAVDSVDVRPGFPLKPARSIPRSSASQQWTMPSPDVPPWAKDVSAWTRASRNWLRDPPVAVLPALLPPVAEPGLPPVPPPAIPVRAGPPPAVSRCPPGLSALRLEEGRLSWAATTMIATITRTTSTAATISKGRLLAEKGPRVPSSPDSPDADSAGCVADDSQPRRLR